MENLDKKPKKGILKNCSSIERQDSQTQLNRQSSQEKDLKWDEVNIIQTLHPADKDYGHMKIEEPKTPYSYYAEDDEGELHSDNEAPNEIDPENLAELISRKSQKPSKSKFDFENVLEKMDQDGDSDEEFANETEEERKRRKEFENKRKSHYNEFQMVKLARELLQKEMDEEEDGTGNQ